MAEMREGLNLDCPTSQQEVELMLVKRRVWAADRTSDEKDSKKKKKTEIHRETFSLKKK